MLEEPVPTVVTLEVSDVTALLAIAERFAGAVEQVHAVTAAARLALALPDALAFGPGRAALTVICALAERAPDPAQLSAFGEQLLVLKTEMESQLNRSEHIGTDRLTGDVSRHQAERGLTKLTKAAAPRPAPRPHPWTPAPDQTPPPVSTPEDGAKRAKLEEKVTKAKHPRYALGQWIGGGQALRGEVVAQTGTTAKILWPSGKGERVRLDDPDMCWFTEADLDACPELWEPQVDELNVPEGMTRDELLELTTRVRGMSYRELVVAEAGLATAHDEYLAVQHQAERQSTPEAGAALRLARARDLEGQMVREERRRCDTQGTLDTPGARRFCGEPVGWLAEELRTCQSRVEVESLLFRHTETRAELDAVAQQLGLTSTSGLRKQDLHHAIVQESVGTWADMSAIRGRVIEHRGPSANVRQPVPQYVMTGQMSSSPVIENRWGVLGGEVHYHEDGAIGYALNNMGSDDRLAVDGEPLRNVLGLIATDLVRGQATSVETIEKVTRIRDRTPEGSRARQALTYAVRQLTPRELTPMPETPDGTPAPLVQLARDLHTIPLAHQYRSGANEIERLGQIIGDVASGRLRGDSTQLVWVVREQLLNGRHESKEGKFELDRAVQRAMDALEEARRRSQAARDQG